MRTLAATLAMFLIALTAVAQTPEEKDQRDEERILASQNALQRLSSTSVGTWSISKHKDTDLPRVMFGARSKPYGTNAVEAARRFLDDNPSLFLPGNSALPPQEQISFELVAHRDVPGSDTVEFQEFYKGISVYRSTVSLMVDANGSIVHVANSSDPRARVSTSPAKSRADAHQANADYLSRNAVPQDFQVSQTELTIFPGDTPRLAYQVLGSLGPDNEPWEYVIDANTGEVVLSRRLVLEHKNSSVSQAKGGAE